MNNVIHPVKSLDSIVWAKWPIRNLSQLTDHPCTTISSQVTAAVLRKIAYSAICVLWNERKLSCVEKNFLSEMLLMGKIQRWLQGKKPSSSLLGWNAAFPLSEIPQNGDSFAFRIYSKSESIHGLFKQMQMSFSNLVGNVSVILFFPSDW